MKLQNITESQNASSRRRYDDACGTAHALDLIGERWALLVMRELMLGPKRFGDIRADLPGISANVLTQRLEGLEATGIVVRTQLPPPAAVKVYGLTEWGYQALPIIGAMGRWASRSPAHDANQHFSATSLMLSFQAMGQAELMKEEDARIGFRLGRESFIVRIENGVLKPTRIDDLANADLVFTGTPGLVAAAIYGDVPLADLETQGAITLNGDRALATRFLTFFPLPPKAPVPAS